METRTLRASDGQSVTFYHWRATKPRAVIHLAHGMGEHAQRYDEVARRLAGYGFEVYADDHRGHGATAQGDYGYMGGDGWNRCLADGFELNTLIRAEHRETPLVLLGHSMGAMLATQYVTRHGSSVDALVLSGSPGFKHPAGSLISRVIAAVESWRLGPAAASPLLQKLVFGAANKSFDGANASGFEWLSRDAAQVQRYLDDQACGFVLSAGSLKDLFAGAAAAARDDCLAKIPKALPVYVFSGSDDPVHGEQKDLDRLLAAYRAAGVAGVTCKLYPAGRHEMFNETNRDEVLDDLVAWLIETLKALPAAQTA